MRPWTWYLAATGAVSAVTAAVLDPSSAAAAAAQTWPAFVLVAGLLMIGLVAAADSLFAAAGERLAGASESGSVLFAGFAALVLVVTALLNLDTSVAFLTPVAVHTGRRRGEDAAVLVSACVLLSNAGSLLLPGSNLTNLIVLGQLHLSGGRFAQSMGLPWLAAGLVTAAVVGWAGRHRLRRRVPVAGRPERPATGLGLAAVAAAVAAVVALGNPAPEVAAVGAAAVAVRLLQHRVGARRVWEVLGLPVLLGLSGLAVALGTLGRDWSLPSQGLAHLDPWATAAVAAVGTVVANNLPAAALLSARAPAHPLSLLIGLDVGPNLFVSGSLAWVLWYNSARASGGVPQLKRTVRLGLASAPLALAAAVGVLLLAGGRT